MNAIRQQMMRKRWADPEWKARQRKLISQGLLSSPHVAEAARRAAETRRLNRAGEAPEHTPWKPGDPKPDWLRRSA